MKQPRRYAPAVLAATLLGGIAFAAPAAFAAAPPAPSPAAIDHAARHLKPGTASVAGHILNQTLRDWGVSVPASGGRFSATSARDVRQTASSVGYTGTDLATELAVIGYGTRAARLQLYNTGPQVSALQRALRRGGSPIVASGTFDPATAAAVSAFQKRHGLRVDGRISLWRVERILGAHFIVPAPAKTQTASGASAPAGQPTPASVSAVLSLAMQQVGKPFVWGGAGPSAFDCSGLVEFVFAHAAGLSLPHASTLQWDRAAPVAPNQLQPGDLVFFNTDGAGPTHVGIYLGGVARDFVDATNPTGGVRIDSLLSAYWAQHYLGARRLLPA